MATIVTLTTELSRERLLELRDEIDALLGGAGQQPSAEPATAAAHKVQPPLDQAAQTLKGRTGASIQKLVRHLVDKHPAGTFTWADVAKEMGVDLDSVKSWHRSLAKPLNRIHTATPGMPSLLQGTWDGSRQVYRLSPDWVEAIKRTW